MISRKVPLSILLALYTLLTSHTNVDAEWKWFGPPGGQIRLIVPDPNNPKIWYVVNNDRLYRSEDGSLSWRFTGLSDVQYYRNEVANTLPLAVHPVTSEVLVTTQGQHTKLWASRDHGKTFQLRANLSFPLTRILFHPRNPNTVYGFGLAKYDFGFSRDGGRTWVPFQNLPVRPGICAGCVLKRYEFEDLFVFPSNVKELYVSGSVYFRLPGEEYEGDVSNFLWRSENGGASWRLVNQDYRTDFYHDIHADRLFAFNQSGINVVSSGYFKKISHKRLNQIISIPGSRDELIGAYYSKGFRSTDGGRTWSDYSLQNRGEVTSRIQPLDRLNTTLLLGTDGAGMYRGNADKGYEPVNRGFRDTYVFDLEVAEGHQPSLYVLLPNSGFGQSSYFFASPDAGRTWLDLTFRLPFRRVDQIVANPKNRSHLILADSSGSIWVSRNAGKSWKRSDFHSRDCCYWDIDFNPRNPQQVFLVEGSGGAVFVSHDGGISFRKFLHTYHWIEEVIVDENDPRILYLLTVDGLFKSVNGGSLVDLNSSIAQTCARCDPQANLSLAPLGIKDGYLLLVGSNENPSHSEIYVTFDAANSWKKIGNAPGDLSGSIHTADVQGLHFFVFSAGVLYETVDGGTSWKNISDALGSDTSINEIGDTRRFPLFVSTNRGIYLRSTR